MLNAKRRKLSWLSQEEYSPLVQKVQITRSKKIPELKAEVVEWILNNTRPTSNSKNIVKWVDKNKEKHQHAVYWRDKTIQEMFESCKLSIAHGEELHKTYFYNLIPKFIKKAKKKDGLCPYHMSAHHWASELEKKRIKWHMLQKPQKRCGCTCVFCTQCSHRKTPSEGGRCSINTCTQCSGVKYPAEWKDDKNCVWYTSSLAKRGGGGMHWVDTEHKGTRREMMEAYTKEMESFHQHDKRCEWVKEQVNWLKKNLPVGNVLIRGDFIQNIVHSRRTESASAYYGKRQTQLLTFVVWYHDVTSTEDKPVIKMCYMDYLSGYLKHTSLFFQKCFIHLVKFLKTFVPENFTKVYR